MRIALTPGWSAVRGEVPSVAMYHAKTRMPVILHRDDFDLWLHGRPEEVPALYRPYPADRMAVGPVV